MAKMKWDGDIDWSGLDKEEYNEDDSFEPYEGPIPPSNTVLKGVVKKLWSTQSQQGNVMFKALWVAEGNEDEKEKYNGLPIWDNVNWTLPQCKFSWQPFLNAMNITLKDVKLKTLVEDDDDNVGTPVNRIGQAKFPYPASVITGRDSYQGEQKATVKKWLEASEDDEYDDDEEDEQPF